jgi:nitrate/nitrite transporter NarK
MGTIGGVLMGLGLCLSSFAKTPLIMVLTFSLLLGTGIGINNVVTTPAAMKWYAPQKKGMISGIVVAGIGFASVFYSPLINSLSASVGIAKSFMILGVGAAVLIVLMAQFLRNPPEGYIPAGVETQSSPAAKAAVGGRELNWKEMLKTSDFYMLWLMLAFASAAGLMVIGHIAKIAKVQASWDGGYLLVALLAVFNAFGRFMGGIVSDRIGRVNLLRIAFILQAVNMALFSFFTSTWLLAVGVVLAGLCYGATFSAFPAITADFYGTKNLGMNYGIIFTAWGCGGVIGPLIAGSIFDATKSYGNAYLLSLALLVVAVVLTFFTGKKMKAANH